MNEHEKTKYIVSWTERNNVSYGHGSEYSRNNVYDDYNEALKDYQIKEKDGFLAVELYVAELKEVSLRRVQPNNTLGFTIRHR